MLFFVLLLLAGFGYVVFTLLDWTLRKRKDADCRLVEARTDDHEENDGLIERTALLEKIAMGEVEMENVRG